MTGLRTASHTPSSASDTGTAGQVNYDTDYIYLHCNRYMGTTATFDVVITHSYIIDHKQRRYS